MKDDDLITYLKAAKALLIFLVVTLSLFLIYSFYFTYIDGPQLDQFILQ
tara:strand:+ start:7907 stop:8053 length:147 start_codon:yes stop_codon:yes gene_type:complete